MGPRLLLGPGVLMTNGLSLTGIHQSPTLIELIALSEKRKKKTTEKGKKSGELRLLTYYYHLISNVGGGNSVNLHIYGQHRTHTRIF